MPAPVSEPLRSTTSRRARAPRAWPGARDAIPRPLWVGCTPITPRVLTRSGFAAPAADPPLRSDCGGASRRRLRRPAYGRHPTPRGGRPGTTVDPEAAGAVCARALRPPLLPRDDPHSPAPPHAVVEASCRGSKLSWKQAVVEASCRGSKLSWKQAKKLLGRANPERRQAFVEQVQSVLEGAQRDQHLVVFLDEAHIHQDADLGYGWATRGERFFVASSSPGLSARVSFYGLYLYNEGQVRLWPFPRANGDHTIEVLRRLRAEWPDRKLIVLWDGAPYHRAQAVREAARALDIRLMPLPGYSPDLMPVEALWHWLREDVTYHHCHASADDLTRRVADFEARLNREPFVIADRLWVKDHLNPEEEKLRFSN